MGINKSHTFAIGQTNPKIAIGVNTDFNLTPITGSATVNPITGAVWDNAIWDNPNATWVGSLTTYGQWSTPSCWPGEYCAVGISLSAATQTLWSATNWMFSVGSSFG